MDHNDEEILINYKYNTNEHDRHHTVKYLPEDHYHSRYYQKKSHYSSRDRNHNVGSNQPQRSSFSEFKEKFRNVKIHIFLVNCSAPLSPNDRDLWEHLFDSLYGRLSGRYSDENVFIHVTDEPYGLHKICTSKLKKYEKNVITHVTVRDKPDMRECMRIRNDSAIKELANIRDRDPDNVFPLIIGFNSGKNIEPIEHFRELSHRYEIKMIEKRKNDVFVYSPDFNQSNYPFLNQHVDRKRNQIPFNNEIDYEDDTHNQKQDEQHQEIIEASSIPSSSSAIEEMTDKQIMEHENQEDESIMKLKRQRKIPSSFVDHTYYPNGDLRKTMTITIFPSELYPNYDSEEEE